jgi:D-tagatose-1,6-bisphosphate aldolase subunit GatZ/KbaZ
MVSPVQKIIQAHKSGQPAGICSVCSANRYALEAALLQAKDDNSLVLIESTSNQVDQFGGYTGMTPAQFVSYVKNIVRKMEFPFEQVVLGGDHLGPNVWQKEKAASAMEKACQLIRAYVSAGFCKIHLDTSMRCGDDSGAKHDPLAPEIIAERAARLCEVAEKTYYANTAHLYPPLYVIGTEVPIPGGAREELSELKPSEAEDTVLTIELTRQAFLKRDLEAAWERVIAVVVQPGVEFGDATVIDYDRRKASRLTALIEKYDNLVYEAHSTDYQSKEALRQMVEDHFAILKVGPWLTFVFREAVFALAEIEKEWLSVKRKVTPSRIKEVIEGVMKKNPRHWQKHYKGDETELFFARQYSYSDRIRYYWPNPEISKALDTLICNLSENLPPLNLLGQYLPFQQRAVREGRIPNTPLALIHHKIMEVTAIYSAATQLKTLERVSLDLE